MKVRKFRTEKAVGPRGFSRWIQPNMRQYLMQCCDCGLVHEIQFRIAAGNLAGDAKTGGQKMHVLMRVRRAVRHTAQARKAREGNEG